MEINMEIEDGMVVYKVLTPDMFEEALEVFTKSFYPYEAISLATDVSLHQDAMEDLNNLSLKCFKDNISIVGIDRKTGKIISVAVNKLQFQKNEDGKFLENFIPRCKSKEAVELITFVSSCDDAVDVFREYNVDKLMEIIFLATAPEYRNRGVAVGTVAACLRLLESSPRETKQANLAVALMTSNYSQAIAEKLQFDTLYEVNYTDFKCKGVKFSGKVYPWHISSRLVAKRVQLC